MFPQLFHIGSFFLPTYGLLVALGVIAGLTMTAKLSRSQNLDPEQNWNLGVLASPGGHYWRQALLFVNDWSYYSSHPGESFSLSTLQAGGVFSGGVIAAVLVSLWYIRRHHMPVLRTCDTFAPGLALGHAIGRIGCFAAGCCYGKPTSHFWGVTFTNAFAHERAGTPLGVPLEPTQLIESAVELVNFFILYSIIKHKKFEGRDHRLLSLPLSLRPLLHRISARRSRAWIDVQRRDDRHPIHRDPHGRLPVAFCGCDVLRCACPHSQKPHALRQPTP